MYLDFSTDVPEFYTFFFYPSLEKETSKNVSLIIFSVFVS